MTTDVERLRKRIDRRLGEVAKLGKDIDKLFDIIEERGQIIDTLARQVEQADVKRDMADDDCEMYKHATLNLEAEVGRLREGLQHIKAWANQPQKIEGNLVAYAVVRMCDDALEAGERDSK